MMEIRRNTDYKSNNGFMVNLKDSLPDYLDYKASSFCLDQGMAIFQDSEGFVVRAIPISRIKYITNDREEELI